MDQLNLITPVTDDEAARMVSPDTFADLAMRITAEPPEQRRRVSARRRRHPLLIGIPLAAGVAASALVVTSLGDPAHQTGPARQTGSAASAPQTQAQALSFVTHGGSITVIVRDPLADPSRYRAEFAQHHLNISLKLIPVSPSLVGTLVYIGQSSGATDLTPITAKGRCYTGGAGSACPVGVRVPAGFHGEANLVFGRAAKPGEQYGSAASAFGPGEAMYGMSISGERVSRILAQLRARHVTVPIFDDMGTHPRPDQVPGSWYVYDAVPWAPQQVMLFVGPTAKQPSYGSGVRGEPSNRASAAAG
jgi:hypothetical protein